MKVAVTGAGGYVGRHCVHALLRAGHEVLAISSSPQPAALSHVALRWHVLRWDDAGAPLGAQLRAFDAVVHAAARVHRNGAAARDEAAFQRDNVALTERIARAALAAEIGRFVFLSSIAVYGDHERDEVLGANSRLRPETPYARSKVEAEAVLSAMFRAAHAHCSILRPPVVYGPASPGNMTRLMHAVAAGWPMPLGAAINNHRSLVHVETLARACVWAATRDLPLDQDYKPSVWLPCDARPVSTVAMIEALAEGLGRRARLPRVPEQWMRSMLKLAGRGRLAAQLFGSLEIESGEIRRAGWVDGTNSLTRLTEMGAAYNRSN